jgi:hypothetical protein
MPEEITNIPTRLSEFITRCVLSVDDYDDWRQKAKARISRDIWRANNQSKIWASGKKTLKRG